MQQALQKVSEYEGTTWKPSSLIVTTAGSTYKECDEAGYESVYRKWSTNRILRRW